ncbi:hypothetical protein [uncultured Microbacterium sp.]|uniref:hypothetical protein n=1 Tax=uncultured Microbacterium sp. TaxID=191216 RepID=UPI0028D86871|nr:hypothetical protein [uncultured Microbacterium sp.]
MTDEQQPELRWAPLPPKPSNRGRIWLIVGLVVAALMVAGVLLLFLLPRGESPDPSASGTPSPTASSTRTPTPTDTPSSTPSPTPSDTASATPAPEPTQTPITTPPPPPDPSIGVFRDTVQGWLDDALTGLDIVSESSGQEAVDVVDTLQNDAQRLSESAPPASIESDWHAAVADYAQALSDLRAAVASGGDSSGAASSAQSAVGTVRSLVGL